MKNDKEIKEDLKNLRCKSFQEIEYVLRKYDYNAQDMLSSFVASVCDIDIADMLTTGNQPYAAQARWLFWNAYRYMTHETYERISERTILDGCKFTSESVRTGIFKIQQLIEEDDTWKGRWLIIKRMIKLWRNPHDYYDSDNSNPMPMKYKVTMRVPQNIEVEIKKEK